MEQPHDAISSFLKDAKSTEVVSRLTFPPNVTAKQRAILHEFAETNGLQHGSVGDTEQTRRLVLWKDAEDGVAMDLKSDSPSVTMSELAQMIQGCLNIDSTALLQMEDVTQPETKGRSKTSTGKSGTFGSMPKNLITVDEFVTKMGPLITLEKDAEMDASRESNSLLKPESAQKRGRTLLNLKCTDAESGLLGKTLLTLKPNKAELLPPHKFTPHDVVAIKTNKAESTAPSIGQGVVYRVRDVSITVAVDDVPEDGLDVPLRIEKLTNDVTYKRLKDTLGELSKGVIKGPASDLVPVLFGTRGAVFAKKTPEFSPFNKGLDHSQRAAVSKALGAANVVLLHGPPGTGKTTTVIEVILQEVKRGSKVLACAASNIAVDNIVERLSRHKVGLVRLGHPARLLPSVLNCSLDALVLKTDNSALANDVRKEMQQINSKLLKTKDRREKGELRRELRKLAKEEKQRQQRAVESVIKDSSVILTTLTGALSRQLERTTFDLVIIDEAAQALEVACWAALLKGRRCLLSGDHLQLPPTVQSPVAEKGGLGITLFERLASLLGPDAIAMLTVQYRMHANIMRWSSEELYDGKITAHTSVAKHKLTDLESVKQSSEADPALVLIDTAGCDMEEMEEEGGSRQNSGEASVVLQHARRLMTAGLTGADIGIITPYSAQVGLLKEMRAEEKDMATIEISTVDGFQGREKEAIIISMVRSNDSREVGFLADNRRMNVAVTRARRQCCIVCDSDTVSHDPFLKRMLDYMEKNGELLSAMEYVS